MSHIKVLVTGATGRTGSAVIKELLKRGLAVRAMVRRNDHRSDELRKLGVEIAVADLFDPEHVARAIRGTQRAYFLPAYSPYMIQAAAAFAIAAANEKLEHIVQMSQWTSSPAHPSIFTRQTWLVDKLFAQIPGVGHTIVNPGMFADNYLRMIDMAALLGLFPVLSGTSKSSPVSNEDIARVVATILADPENHAEKSYRPTGPKLLSAQEMAGIIAGVVGHRVRPVNIPIWMLGKVARMQGVHPFEISGYRYYMQDHKRGTFEFEGGVTDVVRELTGTPAEDFETTARRYASLPFAKQTVGNRLLAWARFMITPAYPGYNLDKWDREHGLPMPSVPQLTMDSPTWIREHASRPPAGSSDGSRAEGIHA